DLVAADVDAHLDADNPLLDDPRALFLGFLRAPLDVKSLFLFLVDVHALDLHDLIRRGFQGLIPLLGILVKRLPHQDFILTLGQDGARGAQESNHTNQDEQRTEPAANFHDLPPGKTGLVPEIVYPQNGKPFLYRLWPSEARGS